MGMILTAMAMLAQEAVRPIKPVPPIVTARPAAPILATPPQPLALRKQRLLGDGRAALARAQTLQKSYVAKPGGPSKAELDAQIDQLKTELDSLSEMGETESLRLQMAMDRVAKFMTALSNIEKKASDTDSAIIQNFK